MNRIFITSSVCESIAEHLVATYPDEGCGALAGRMLGDELHVCSAWPIRNVEPTRGADRFVLDPTAYSKLEQKLHDQNDGTSVIGFFHSHPDGLPRPSSIDLEMARGVYEFARVFYIYSIQTTQQGGAGELTFWRLSDELDKFISVPAEVR